MKRCPECRRDYYDDTLNYCLSDGTELVHGLSPDEPATAILAGHGVPLSGDSGSEPPPLRAGQFDSESVTRPQINTTDKTAIFPRPAEAESSRSVGSRHRVRAGIGVAVLLIGAIGFAVFKFWPKNTGTPRSMSVERLTTDGRSREAAISPDGKFVVYVVDEGTNLSLWTRQVATTSNVQIAPPAAVHYSGLVITPDNNYVTFLKRDRTDAPPVLVQMPVLGGTQKKLISVISSGVAYSPDGKQLAFVRHTFPTPDESALMIANADGSGERVVTTLKGPEFFGTVGGQMPSWAPDGKSIAAVAFSVGENSGKVVEIQVGDGSMETIEVEGWHYIRRIQWLPDKGGFLILGADKPVDRFHQQIWKIAYPSGEVSRVTSDSTNYYAMSFSPEAGTLAVVPLNAVSNIWSVPGGDTARATQLKFGGVNLDGAEGMSRAPDGRIVYQSLASGNEDIWIMNEDGSSPKQLTPGTGQHFEPDVSPDGRYVVYTSGIGRTLNIWRMELDGSNQKQLTDGNSDDEASVSPDSRWVIFASRRSGDWRLWKVSIDGGDAVQMSDLSAREPQVSPDGKMIACEYREDINSPWRMALLPFEGGTAVRKFDSPGAKEFRWSPDSRSLIYNDLPQSVGNLWSVSIDGGPAKQLTQFKAEWIFNFDLSPDSKQLVIARGTITNDVLLIKDFR